MGNYSRGIHGRWDSRSSGRGDRDSDSQSDWDSGKSSDKIGVCSTIMGLCFRILF